MKDAPGLWQQGLSPALEPGDHACCFFDTRRGHEAWLTAVLGPALGGDRKVLYLAAASLLQELPGRLKDAGLDPEQASERGQLITESWDRTSLLREGVVDPGQVLEFLRREGEKARAEGYSALLCLAELTEPGKGRGQCRGLGICEVAPSEVLAANHCLLVCLCDRSRTRSQKLLRALDHHPRIGVDGLLYDNPYYLPPVPPKDRDPGAASFAYRIDTLRRTEQREAPPPRPLADENPVGIWHFDLDRRSLYANPALYALFEIDASEPLDGDRLRSCLPPESLETLDHELVRWAGGGTGICEVEIVGERGGRRNVLVSGAPIRSTGGPRQTFIANFLDITGSRYRLLAETANDLTSKLTPDGVFLYVSPASREVLGYDPSDLVGRSVLDFLHPDELRETQQVVAAILEKPFSYRFRRKPGDYVWLESACKAVRDAATGAVAEILVVSRDITERKLAEEAEARLQRATKNAAAEWRATFDSIESPLLIVDRHGQIQRMNRAAMELSGKDYAENLGESLVASHSGEPWQRASELVRQVSVERAPTSTQLPDADEERVWEISARPRIRSSAGDEQIILMFRDITEQVALQESLRRSEIMSTMGTLVAGVAHEVRNPLFAISSTLDAFEARFGGQESHRPFLKVLHGEVKRMTDLMYELLEYGKSPSATLLPGSLCEVLEDSVRACSTLADQQGVAIQLEAGPDLPTVDLDRNQLPHVFRNLLDNAIRASPSGGKVRIHARSLHKGDGTWVECQVEDSGPGFKSQHLPRVFEPFFSRRRGGTGLGLAIVQRIVEAHCGKIRLGNRGEGGAVACVLLPVTRRQR